MVKKKSSSKRERRREKDKVGRNDPCPCKSGKKYKKCCLPNDLAQRIAETREQQSLKEEFANRLKITQEKRDEEEELFDWQQFRLSPFKTKLSLFKSEFENADPFDLLEIIYQEAARENKMDEFKECLDSFKLRKPQEYEKDEMYYSSWLLQIAIANNHYTQISALLDSYRRHPDAIFDIFLRDIDLLMFSGRTTELLELMIEVAPTIVASHKIMLHGVDEFFSILTFLLILQFIEQNDLNEENMPKLLSQLEDLEIGYKEEVVSQTISRLSGQLETEWKPDGFDETIQRTKRDKNFFDLSVDFMVYLHTEHNIPLSQCELARCGIVDFLRKQTRLKKRKDEASILYPRERELDKHLSIYLGVFAPRPSRLVAVVGLLPYYVLFLAENGLVHWPHVKRVVSDVERLKTNTLKYFDKHALGNYYIPMITNMWDLANQLIHKKILDHE